MLIRLLTVAALLLMTSTAGAQMESVKTAMFLVDGFFDEAMYVTRDLPKDERLTRVVSEMRKRKDDTLAALKTVRWVDSPGQERYDKVYKIVSDYSDAQILSIEMLKEGHEKKDVNRMVRTLKSLKKKKLKTLEGTHKYETYRAKNPLPVPIVDKSPFESGGKTGTGGEIWFR
ncbi:MAG: hypothetical protein ACE5DR_02955 [Thermodesulfobacteriota bacterium]